MSGNRQDQANRAWYALPGTVRGMTEQEGFSDAGERAVHARLAAEMRGRPLLDLGVGAGRTVALMQSISNDYVGVDYLPTLLAAARVRHPGADLRVGDARDLATLPADHFALVSFSYQGLDSVGHDGRAQVLREAWRVLAPGGVFWFSTLNRDGPAARYRPWRMTDAPGSLRAWLRACLRIPVHMSRYVRVLAISEWGDGWSVAPFFAGEWCLLTHYVTLPALLHEVAAAGFAPQPEVYDDGAGRRVQPGDDLRRIFSFHILARKAPALGLTAW